jgi:cysteinyl-tRNA synthetase
MDLIFPHHENEVAQSECLHKKPFASIWLHNAFVNINKEKMSKSLGNFITLSALFESHDPMVVRYFYLQHHYRTPIDFSDQELEAARTAYKKLITHFGSAAPLQSFTSKDFETAIQTDERIRLLFEALCDDLNTPKFLGVVFEHLADIASSPGYASLVAHILRTILGLSLNPLEEKAQEITPQIQELLVRREEARKEKNWALADTLRDELVACGYTVQDKKVK